MSSSKVNDAQESQQQSSCLNLGANSPPFVAQQQLSECCSQQALRKMVGMNDVQVGNGNVSGHEDAAVQSNSVNELRFYEQYLRIYTIARNLALEKQRQQTIHSQLVKKIKELEDRMKETDRGQHPRREITSEEIRRIKRSRRTAEEIEKKYKCEVAYCERFYGSEGSLQQHIKLKHPELYRKLELEAEGMTPVKV